MMDRSFRRIVVALRLRSVDNKSRHRTQIDDRAAPGGYHLPPERAAAPEHAIEIDVDDVEPMFVSDVLGPYTCAGDTCIADQDVDVAKSAVKPIRDLSDLTRIS